MYCSLTEDEHQVYVSISTIGPYTNWNRSLNLARLCNLLGRKPRFDNVGQR